MSVLSSSICSSRLPIFAIACFSWAAVNQTKSKRRPYAISIVALVAFLLDGACGRARFVSGSDQKRCSAADTLRHFGGNALADKIEEIFVVRDAIAHAHLWKAKRTGCRPGAERDRKGS